MEEEGRGGREEERGRKSRVYRTTLQGFFGPLPRHELLSYKCVISQDTGLQGELRNFIPKDSAFSKAKLTAPKHGRLE